MVIFSFNYLFKHNLINNLFNRNDSVCLAIPGKIIEIKDDNTHAIVDYGDGTKNKVNVSLVDIKKGQYVLVHAGFAIEVLDKKEAQETINLFREMLEYKEG